MTMGFRFRKTIKIMPGVRLNLSKSGVSLSLGRRGASLNIGTGGAKATVGIPGSGISYSTHLGKLPLGDDDRQPKSDSDSPDQTINLGSLSAAERDLFAGIQALNAGNVEAAYAHLQQAADLPDGAFLMGILALQEGDADAAITHLTHAQEKADQLGEHFAKVSITPLPLWM
jgi:hypothetical protein